jgi:hypothetical protein
MWAMTQITSHDPTNIFTYSKIVAIDNFEILIAWSCWIQNRLQPKCHDWLGNLGVKQGHGVHTKAPSYWYINHLLNQVYYSHLKDFEFD